MKDLKDRTRRLEARQQDQAASNLENLEQLTQIINRPGKIVASRAEAEVRQAAERKKVRKEQRRQQRRLQEEEKLQRFLGSDDSDAP